MKTIKIIELLNKIANGEDVPQKIKYDDYVFLLSNSYKAYYDYEGGQILDKCVNLILHLNDEIEIIEDDKEKKKIEKIGKGHYIDDEEVLEKIDEIIDYINKEEK